MVPGSGVHRRDSVGVVFLLHPSHISRATRCEVESRRLLARLLGQAECSRGVFLLHSSFIINFLSISFTCNAETWNGFRPAPPPRVTTQPRSVRLAVYDPEDMWAALKLSSLEASYQL